MKKIRAVINVGTIVTCGVLSFASNKLIVNSQTQDKGIIIVSAAENTDAVGFGVESEKYSEVTVSNTLPVTLSQNDKLQREIIKADKEISGALNEIAEETEKNVKSITSNTKEIKKNTVENTEDNINNEINTEVNTEEIIDNTETIEENTAQNADEPTINTDDAVEVIPVVSKQVNQTGALLTIENPDESYTGVPVTLTERDRYILEHLVMGEAGNQGYEGAALVAQCIRDTMVYDGVATVEEVRTIYKYSGTLSLEPNQDVLNAVHYIFDEGGMAVKHKIQYFYAPKRCSSKWHEKQQLIIQYGGHRFFDKRHK